MQKRTKLIQKLRTNANKRVNTFSQKKCIEKQICILLVTGVSEQTVLSLNSQCSVCLSNLYLKTKPKKKTTNLPPA